MKLTVCRSPIAGPNNVLNITGSPSPPKCSPVDERQRLASVSYVNYGPTTINGLTESQTKEIFHKPREGTGEMLRSTLEDGFKTMFLSSQSPLGQAVQASTLYHKYQYQARPHVAYQQAMLGMQQNPVAVSGGSGNGGEANVEWIDAAGANDGRSKFVCVMYHLSLSLLRGYGSSSAPRIWPRP